MRLNGVVSCKGNVMSKAVIDSNFSSSDGRFRST